MPIKLITSGGGSAILTPTTNATDYTLTVPAVTANVVTTGDTGSITQAMLGSGVGGKGPAFYAYGSGYTSVSSSTHTKLSYNNELFDTNSNYDTTLSRFTPTVAGYYQISATALVGAANSGYGALYLFKNGAFNYYCWFIPLLTTSWNSVQTFSGIFYANGTTDYFELYGYQTGGTLNMGSSGSDMAFSACLVRAA